MTTRPLFLLLLSLVCTSPSSLCAGDTPTFYDPIEKEIEGWTIAVDPRLMADEHQDVRTKSFAALANHLQRIKYILPDQQVARLQQLRIWLELDNSKLGSMQYHPESDWLRARGHDPRLVKHVHIPRARSLYDRHMWAKHPYVVLHELAHSYHDQVLGFDESEIVTAYEAAKAKGIYDKVLLYTGAEVRHYALTDHKEYFAESTEAYLGVNDFYPFVRAELKRHDPMIFAVMQKVWGPVLGNAARASDSGAADEFAPDQSSLPVAAPKDAIVLFDGPNTNKFLSMSGKEINWPVEDGALVSTRNRTNKNHIVSQVHFRDADIHVEFMVPEKGAGNSGIYIHGNYELQILNSFGKQEPTQDDIGAVYGFSKPLVNAARKPGVWQVYDIRYRAPRRDSDLKIIREGSITAWLNGQQVQAGTTLGEPRSVFHPFRYGTTPYLKTIWRRQRETMTGPVFLQDHSNPVRFRNVWIRPLDDRAFLYTPSGG